MISTISILPMLSAHSDVSSHSQVQQNPAAPIRRPEAHECEQSVDEETRSIKCTDGIPNVMVVVQKLQNIPSIHPLSLPNPVLIESPTRFSFSFDRGFRVVYPDFPGGCWFLKIQSQLPAQLAVHAV